MKYSLKLLFALAFCCFWISESQAQDARFTQFYYAPQQSNPALTGAFNGQYRFIANYRSQYGVILDNNAFKTMAASFDMRLPVGRYDFAAFGLNVMKDDVGVAQFNMTSAALGGAYHKQLGGGLYSRTPQYLVAGFQLEGGQRGFDAKKLWFTNQFQVGANSAFIDYDADSGENFQENNTGLYFGLNAGILYYGIFDHNLSFYVGGSIYHLNQPTISFTQTPDEVLKTKYVFNIGGEFPIADNVSLLPSALVMMQDPSFSTTAGVNLRYNRREWKEVAVRAGVWSHLSNRLEDEMHMDAMSVAAILEMERVHIGLSYDITSSVLKAANDTRGGFEVSFTYIQPPKNRRQKVTCPRF